MSGQHDEKSNADLIYRFDGDDNEKEVKVGKDKEKEEE